MLVCAPAGYGKTVLLADWARRGQQPVAWLSLDAGDNDPARFWRHGVASLAQARPGLAERVGPLLGPPASSSYQGLVTALINELAAEPDAGQVLLVLDVERAGLFLVPLDEVRGWWRYHHIFADLLRARLQAEQPGRAVLLHRNAAAWYAERGLADDAIRHAVAAGEMTWAARLIEQDFDMVYNVRGEGATIQRWFSALPADLVQSRPRLLLVQALLMTTSGRLDAVDALLDAAERAGVVDEPFEPTVGRAASMLVNVPAYIAVDRSYLAQLRGDAGGTAAFAAQALAVIGEGERLLDSVARWQLAIAAWLGGRLAEAERALVDGIAGWHAAGLLAVAASSVYELCQVQRARGRLDAAVQACQQALEVTVVPGRPPRAAAGPAYVGLGELAYERNEMEIALQHVTEGIALCRQWVYTTQLAAGLVTLAWIRQAAGDPADALDAIG
jgi:LuxR family transcriptional regulator, maltose regulon positive regulatory protein